MKKIINFKRIFSFILLIVISFGVVTPTNKISKADEKKSIVEVKNEGSKVEIYYKDKTKAIIDFYNENIFRYYKDQEGGDPKDPVANPPAEILVDDIKKEKISPKVDDGGENVIISTNAVKIEIGKSTNLMKVTNQKNKKIVLEEKNPLLFEKDKVTQSLVENENEYFYGGGLQNGRFSHKGQKINIKNENNWVDGGVASPNPYYWSTNGYGVMRYTFKPGEYDFGKDQKGVIRTTHNTDYFDAFYMVNEKYDDLLNDYYKLTGNPVLMPKFAFYEGHLNAYNRDYWYEDANGILFEDGKRYKESKNPVANGVRETLNGEPGDKNYQFTARAVIDRYINNDMPLGWILPNDGYGAGYGQTGNLDGNIANLKKFTKYANSKGVETGLWTQSDLHPVDGLDPLLQRDIVKEVEEAGVRALKTDVAWVGKGYSFGLNGIADVAKTMKDKGNNSRPFIISLDGWAGSQRYAGFWSGDQTGGNWEYIRFHIPTYIGSGLSGQPNISSDMDGIFGGKKPIINTRDYQWKTFTPMELNMDGWGSNAKYPHVLGEPTTSINRMYLKMKSELMPYTYSIAKEAVNGLPMVRAMFLEDENAYTLGKATQYQYMFGPNLLVAPIYQDTKSDEKGNDIRNNIYLPKGDWIDYFSGERIKGGRIINNIDAPIWKLPVFVKDGAIIPMTNPNNNPNEIKKDLRIYDLYPAGESSFVEYDDDGKTEEYRLGKGSETKIEAKAPKSGEKGALTITVNKTEGDFSGFEPSKVTEFNIHVSEKPSSMDLKIEGAKKELKEATSIEDYNKGTNVFFYDEAPDLNRFSTKGSEFENVEIKGGSVLRVKVEKVNVKKDNIILRINDFINNIDNTEVHNEKPAEPTNVRCEEKDISPKSVSIKWDKVENANYYEIEGNGIINSGIIEREYLIEGLTPKTEYTFKVRAVNNKGTSDWVELKVKTSDDPYEFAIRNIEATASAPAQSGEGLEKFFDFDENNTWHTKWQQKAVPFDVVMDLGSVYNLDKITYLPRIDAGNGTILEGKIHYSTDNSTWYELTDINWKRDSEIKTIEIKKDINAKYLKLSVTKAVGDFGSGRELYVYKKPGTTGSLPGDITGDGLVDGNDFESYDNYTGLRKGDADFEGYVSNGDINGNDLIDAYDISVVGTQIDGGVIPSKDKYISGRIVLTSDKTEYKDGDEIILKAKGIGLTDINAFSMAIPYDQSKYDYIGITVEESLKNMENITKDRLHSNGIKSLYPTFVNRGNKDRLNGDMDLFTVKFKAKRDFKLDINVLDGLLVDSKLNSLNNSIGLNEEIYKKIPIDEINVTGNDSVMQKGNGVANLNDGKLDTMAELMWDYEPNWINGKLPEKVKLPQEFTFEFKDGKSRIIDYVKTHKRANGNGSVKEYEIKAYLKDDEVFNSGIRTVAKDDTGMITDLNKKEVDKIVLKINSTYDSLKEGKYTMMTLKEFEIFGETTGEKTVNKSKLSEKLKDIGKIDKTKYTDVSVKVLEEAIKEAKSVNKDEEATQKEVDEVLAKLIEVAKGLELKADKVDKTDLAKKITDAEKVDKSKYTEESVKALEEAIKEAETVNKKAEVTQKEVYEALEKLKKAIAELKTKPVDPVKPIDPTKPTEPEKESEHKMEVGRISGSNRYKTAIELSKKYFDNSETVIIASGEVSIDSLSSQILADELEAPILLTENKNLPKEVKEEIKRLGAKNITIVGGTNTVSNEIEKDFSKEYGVSRVSGKDRFETASLVAEKYFAKAGNTKSVIIANGYKYADVLSSSSLSIKEKSPVLLTRDNEIPEVTEKLMKEKEVEKVVVAGGSSSVGEKVLDKLPNSYIVLSGRDRYETSVKIAERSYPETKQMLVASGEIEVDALVAGTITGKLQMPILLTQKTKMPESILKYIENKKIDKATIVGGEATVGSGQFNIFK